MHVSVIVTTSPGREHQLERCLTQLTRQLYPHFEVIVADDGSAGGQAVAAAFSSRLKLRYHGQANTASPAATRNAGAALARSERLIFIDSDVLLNVGALAAYVHFLGTHADWLLYGYVGLEAEADSLLMPGVRVNWRDPRFGWNGRQLIPADKLLHSSYQCGFAGNFCLYRHLFEALGGFDARFTGWGGEDLEFAERAVSQGAQVHFLLDAWGEHQVHDRDQTFHRLPAEARGHGYVFRPHPPVPYPVQVFASEQARQAFEQLLRSHYTLD